MRKYKPIRQRNCTEEKKAKVRRDIGRKLFGVGKPSNCKVRYSRNKERNVTKPDKIKRKIIKAKIHRNLDRADDTRGKVTYILLGIFSVCVLFGLIRSFFDGNFSALDGILGAFMPILTFILGFYYHETKK